jgi:hypothetical protein
MEGLDIRLKLSYALLLESELTLDCALFVGEIILVLLSGHQSAILVLNCGTQLVDRAPFLLYFPTQIICSAFRVCQFLLELLYEEVFELQLSALFCQFLEVLCRFFSLNLQCFFELSYSAPLFLLTESRGFHYAVKPALQILLIDRQLRSVFVRLFQFFLKGHLQLSLAGHLNFGFL